jgi:hypothetical protein
MYYCGFCLQALCGRAGRFRKDFAASVRAFSDAHGADGEMASSSLPTDPAEVEATTLISQVC